MSSQGTADSPQVKVIRSFAQGIEKMDADQIISVLHKDHRRVTYPRSIGRADENREEWAKRIVEVVSLWTKCAATFHSIIEAPGGKVIAHFTIKAETIIGVDMVREMIFIAHIAADEDGSLKIKQFEEFADSKAYLDFSHSVDKAKASGHFSA